MTIDLTYSSEGVSKSEADITLPILKELRCFVDSLEKKHNLKPKKVIEMLTSEMMSYFIGAGMPYESFLDYTSFMDREYLRAWKWKNEQIREIKAEGEKYPKKT